MNQLWKKLLSFIMVLMASVTLTGCAELLGLLEEEYESPPVTQTQRTSTTRSEATKGQTRPSETTTTPSAEENPELAAIPVEEDGAYDSKMEVAAYLYQFGHLPDNYLTKSEARDRGWVAEKGNLWKVTDRMSIGGDRFGNYEGLLPDQKGRQYYEADIDYRGGGRNAKRIVFSNDGLIFYTDDHYESFEQLN